MTESDGQNRVRRLLNQTDADDSQFSDTMLSELLNQARHIYADILPQKYMSNLIKTETIAVGGTYAGHADFPSDFLRPIDNPYVTIDSVSAKKIPEEERWRLHELENNENTGSGYASTKYYRETSKGIEVYPNTATTIDYEYLAKPTDLSAVDNTEFAALVDDMCVDFAFQKCMGTQRGDVQLAVFLAEQQGILINRLKGIETGGLHYRGEPGVPIPQAPPPSTT